MDNRPGADGIIGTELAARSPADRHTLLIISISYTMNPAIHKLPYDPVKAFAPLGQIASLRQMGFSPEEMQSIESGNAIRLISRLKS